MFQKAHFWWSLSSTYYSRLFIPIISIGLLIVNSSLAFGQKPSAQHSDAIIERIQECLENVKGQISVDDSLFTFIDFTKPSHEKRLFVYHLKDSSIIFSSLVAHGRNSGSIKANQFSNRKESYQSSLGFFKTAETYYGKHGYSLRLDGLEKSINDNARKRAIVIHGAAYVSRDFIKKYGRLGRSLGCPAVPEKDAKQLIDLIKNGSPLFIYAPQYYTKYNKHKQASTSK